MRFFLGILCLCALGSMANVVPESKETRLAHASNDLAFRLLRSYVDEKNVFISPVSISTALGMLYLGADGTTAQEMRRVLKYDQYQLSDQEVHEAFHSVIAHLNANDNDYHFSSYNGALVQQSCPVLESYVQTLREQYSARVENVDFALEGDEVKDRINRDVHLATRQKIGDFLKEPLSTDTVLFLFNAVYFLGSWENPFNLNSTHESRFYNNGVEEKSVQMMYKNSDYQHSTSNGLNSDVVVLPYRGDDSASMIIVVPKQRNGVDDLLERINKDSLDLVLSSLDNDRVLLSVPRFSLEHSSELSDKLSALGLEELFDEGANLSRIAGNQLPLRVSKVLHKATIDVDEKGTEAAGVTGMEISLMSLAPMVRADHPFLFFIRDDQTGMIMFCGKVDEL